MSDFEPAPDKWSIRNSDDIKSLADKLDGKFIKFSTFDGHSGESYEFPSRDKAKKFVKVLEIFEAYERLLYSTTRWWNQVIVYYRNCTKNDEINNV